MITWLRRLRDDLNNIRLTLLVTLLFTMLVASIFPTPAIRYMVALLCAGPFVGALMAQLFGRALTASRTAPATATVGDVINGQLTLHNKSPLPIFFVQADIGEVVIPGAPSPVAAAEGKDQIVTMLRPREEISLPLHWRMTRRGLWTLPPLKAGATDPLGVSSWLKANSPPHQITVFPRPLRVFRLGFLPGSQQGARPISHAARVTEAMDFHGIREWQPGEGVRRLHWKSTARTGRLHVVEWEEDLAADLIILLDTRVARSYRAGHEHLGIETAVTLSATIAAYLLDSGYQVELVYWQAQTTKTAAMRPPGQAKAHGVDDGSPLRLCHQRAGRDHRLSEVLQALSALQPVTAPSATLAALIEQAAPALDAGRNVLLIAQDEADTGDALDQLSAAGIGPGQCTVFSIQGLGTEQPARLARRHRVRARIIRPGDSLVAMLEGD